jgi:SAM-dependent methyltransferase
MTDLNSLEKFNNHYKAHPERVFEKSLSDFFNSQVSFRLPKNPRILDLGPGSKSVFEETDLDQSLIAAVDFSAAAIELSKQHSQINYMLGDISSENAIASNRFDLIFDSHCLHCIVDPLKRSMSFQNIYQGLKEQGLFCSEMMVQPVGKTASMPFKFIPTARDLEQELIQNGFKIIYFMIVKELLFENDNEECDLLRVICQK